ncbi:hypothetical protein [Bradyrhizobium vignae]|uniref:hypothetical protein n=1 Tax=Bradyrhizobium vignae TaxID=1549949 RepID=UPI00100AB5E6|nr:hypothetical protein [Bradyrhizobium vignae]RXG97179.1 hypothetical protein EAV90_22685 [Bradyrhizobium vignae]
MAPGITAVTPLPKSSLYVSSGRKRHQSPILFVSLGGTASANFTEEIAFVAACGGSFTPPWKLARISAGASSNLIVGQRTNTNDLIITLGPIKTTDSKGNRIDYTSGNTPVQLEDYAVNQHQARGQAAAIAVSVSGQSH